MTGPTSARDDPAAARVHPPWAWILLLALGSAACDLPTEAPPNPQTPPATQSALELRAIYLSTVPHPTGLSPGCTGGAFPSGAVYQICIPPEWNGSFVVYGHGYVRADEPLGPTGEIDDLTLLVGQFGFGFAWTSYRKNGLAIRAGVEDVVELTRAVYALLEPWPDLPRLLFLSGASEGGAVSTLAVERHSTLFDGAISTCGPTGNFRKQIDYFGDFRVLFDYFFPGVLPGEAVFVDPTTAWPAWDAGLIPAAIARALLADQATGGHATRQLLAVSGAPVDPGDPTSIGKTVAGILWYNLFGTNEARATLGDEPFDPAIFDPDPGPNPFDNRWRWYRGSDNDWALNRAVARHRADAEALSEIGRYYETSGRLADPYVSLHTTADEIVPFSQQVLYRIKAWLRGSAREHSAVPILRYGHCSFTNDELVAALALLLLKATGLPVPFVAEALPTRGARSAFHELRTADARSREKAPESTPTR